MASSSDRCVRAFDALRSAVPLSGWQQVLADDARQVLRPTGALVAAARLRPLDALLAAAGASGVRLWPLGVRHGVLIVAVETVPEAPDCLEVRLDALAARS